VSRPRALRSRPRCFTVWQTRRVGWPHGPLQGHPPPPRPDDRFVRAEFWQEGRLASDGVKHRDSSIQPHRRGRADVVTVRLVSWWPAWIEAGLNRGVSDENRN
jgi:hypothetical protein